MVNGIFSRSYTTKYSFFISIPSHMSAVYMQSSIHLELDDPLAGGQEKYVFSCSCLVLCYTLGLLYPLPLLAWCACYSAQGPRHLIPRSSTSLCVLNHGLYPLSFLYPLPKLVDRITTQKWQFSDSHIYFLLLLLG